MRKLAILGSTGSIGTQTLEVVRNYPDKFQVKSLACGTNINLLFKQIEEFKPVCCSVATREIALELEKMLKDNLPSVNCDVLYGDEGNISVATLSEVDTVTAAMVGVAGLIPVIEAIKAGKDIALANKETLVAGGEIVMPLVKEKNVKLLPVDSEHSAIWQCLGMKDLPYENLDRILLTASGGPFRGYTREMLKEVDLKKALNHPTWNMGGKITIDSASMMNKGLEVIEACHLFGVEPDRIDVVVHPQSVIHSMIRLKDGSVLGQMGKPSMILPILVALNYPERGESFLEKFDPFAAGVNNLTFEKCDTEVFGLLKLAYYAGKKKGLLPAVMNAANEEAVGAFLKEKISFISIEETVSEVVNLYEKENAVTAVDSLDSVLLADKWARDITRRIIYKGE